MDDDNDNGYFFDEIAPAMASISTDYGNAGVSTSEGLFKIPGSVDSVSMQLLPEILIQNENYFECSVPININFDIGYII